MRFLFELAGVTIFDLTVFKIKSPKDDDEVVVVHHYRDDEDDSPNDMFGGK